MPFIVSSRSLNFNYWNDEIRNFVAQKNKFMHVGYIVVMSERVFLLSIFESGYSTKSRLVYADWLEEIGDWRAELIRVNCLLSEVDSANDDPETISGK